MQEAFVELTCPDCEKLWETKATTTPAPDESFACPDCGTERALSEFARTQRDLEVLQEL